MSYFIFAGLMHGSSMLSVALAAGHESVLLEKNASESTKAYLDSIRILFLVAAVLTSIGAFVLVFQGLEQLIDEAQVGQ